MHVTAPTTLPTDLTVPALPIRVAVVEDEAPIRKLFESAIRLDAGMQLCFSVATVKDAIAQAPIHGADVYLIDLGLPDADGREFIRWLKQHQPEALPMVVTVFGDDAHIVSSFAAGAMGYLLKDASSQEIAEHIHKLVSGGSPISPSVARRLLLQFTPPIGAGELPMPMPAPSLSDQVSDQGITPLSDREHEVLRLIEKGLSYDEIAGVLGITWHTVTSYLRRVYRKLEVKSRGEAVFEARQRGLL